MKFLSYVLFLFAVSTATATTLATRGAISVTTEDFYAFHYMNAPKKVEALQSTPREVQNTITEILAPRSYNRQKELHSKLDPIEQRYVQILLERGALLAELNVLERRTRAAFNANDPVTVARAKELWTVDTTRFMVDETADITQIFFDLSARPFAEVVARIGEAQKALATGDSFENVLQKYSDDKAVKETGGKLFRIASAGSDPLMGNVIFKRLKEGEFSAPTSSRIGMHIVRLDKKNPRSKRPFEEVKGQLIEQTLEDTVKNVRLKFLENLASTETVINDKAFEDFLIKPDPSLDEKRRAIYRDLGIQISEPIAPVKQ
jgi:peptidyl-prolyl cis-trans isomerase C